MEKDTELRESWQRTLRFLASARYYLPELLPSAAATEVAAVAAHLLHNNELQLAYEELQELGVLVSAPSEFWAELHLAAASMGLLQNPHDLAAASQAFLCRLPIHGVLFRHNDFVEVTSGPHVGETGSLVTLSKLGTDPEFVLENDAGGEINVRQSSIRLHTAVDGQE